MPSHAELVCASAFSFLQGTSHAEELVGQARDLGLAALGIADRNTVAGVVRAHEAARREGLRLLVGARLAFVDGTPDVVVYPADRAAWGRLTRLLTLGKRRARKGECVLTRADLAAHAEGLVAIIVADKPEAAVLGELREMLGGRAWLAARREHGADDLRRLHRLSALAQAARLPLVATHDVLYHHPGRKPLADVMTCIRLGTTIDKAGLALAPHAERHLKPPAEMARLFRAFPEAVAASLEIVERVGFSLDQLAYEYPDEPVPPGRTPDEHLARLAWAGATLRYPAGVPDKVRETIAHELAMIAPARLRALFPDRARHRPLRPAQGDPVPGARLGGEFGGVLRARHHRRRARRARPAVRALRLRRAPRAARYRRGFRA